MAVAVVTSVRRGLPMRMSRRHRAPVGRGSYVRPFSGAGLRRSGELITAYEAAAFPRRRNAGRIISENAELAGRAVGRHPRAGQAVQRFAESRVRGTHVTSAVRKQCFVRWRCTVRKASSVRRFFPSIRMAPSLWSSEMKDARQSAACPSYVDVRRFRHGLCSS